MRKDCGYKVLKRVSSLLSLPAPKGGSLDFRGCKVVSVGEGVSVGGGPGVFIDAGSALCELDRVVGLLEPTRPDAVRHPTHLEPRGGAGSGPVFEGEIVRSASRLEKEGVVAMARYSTKSVFVNGKILQIKSAPDFEATIPMARQFLVEAKYSTKSSLSIGEEFVKKSQIAFMLRKRKFDVPGYLLVFFTARLLKTSFSPPFTVALEVKDKSFGIDWESFASSGERQGSISRKRALEEGLRLDWILPPQCRKPVLGLSSLVEEAEKSILDMSRREFLGGIEARLKRTE